MQLSEGNQAGLNLSARSAVRDSAAIISNPEIERLTQA
jgi:hypothetical protein